MKLRNKKTGEIIDGGDYLNVYDDVARQSKRWRYNSLAELSDEWEDYKEPLIKDEKIRKAVRAWAEVNGIERVWHEYASCWLRGNGLKIELENDEVVDLEQKNYTIDELCGEEE